MDATGRRKSKHPSLRRKRLHRRAGILFAAVLLAAAPAGAEQDSLGPDPEDARRYTAGAPEDPSEAWKLAQGGRLYDMWWGTLLTDPPEDTHPAYPSDGQLEGAETWRCVACHGWDYKGEGGANPEGPFRTTIGGIDGAAGRSPAAIARILRNPLHGFTPALLPDDAIALVAAFVSAGQTDADQYIDRKSRRFRGDAERGRAVYQNLCAVCHDFDGRAEIFGEEMELQTLGAVANLNPWLALHKVLNGQPAADMPALRALDIQLALDALAYAQTLPRE